MIPQPPPGQGPIDPRGAFSPPPAPGNVPPPMQQGWQPPPPPMYPPPPPWMMHPPKQRGGFVRGIFVTLATTIFGFSLALNVYLLLSVGLLSGGSSRSTNLVDGDPNKKIAVVPLEGILMDDAPVRFDRTMKQIDHDKNVKAVVLEINSPGGTVAASDEILHRVEQFKKDHPGMPVVVSMGSLAASGGYWVACGGDHLFAQPSTLTGSIGVYMPIYNAYELAQKWGIQDKSVESNGTPFKTAGAMLKPETPEQRAYIQDIADKSFAQFKDVIAKGRGSKLTKPMPDIANGKIYMAADAKALGLVDNIGYLQDAWEYAATKAGLDKSKVTVTRYKQNQGFFDSLVEGKSGVEGAKGKSVTVNGVNVSVEGIQEALTPRLMSLWRGR